jgi:hypothetical protein
MRLIYAKFPTRCGVCKGRIAQGSRCYWEKGFKPVHPGCYTSDVEKVPTKPASTIPPAQTPPQTGREKFYPDFVIDWAELRPMIRAATSESEKLTGWRNAADRARFRNDLQGGTSSYDGFTRGQLHRWITEGYKTDAIQGLAGLTPPIREKRRTMYVEDGDELILDRAFEGEEKYMTTATKREVIPGVKLNIELDASAGSSKMLWDYQRWIAQIIYALETSGVDCEVNIFTLSRNLFREQTSKVCRQMVRVKKEGEKADFAGFSAMFSPAAFRGIMFSTFAIHADRQNLSLRGYGSGVTTAWGVKFSPETASIDVACHWSAQTFPESHMTSLFRQALMEMKKAN